MDHRLAIFAEGLFGCGVEDYVVPLRVQNLLDPASGDRGGLESLLFAAVLFGRDYVRGDSCFLLRASAEFGLEGGQP